MLFTVYDPIRRIRNTIAHAGYADGNFQDDINKARTHVKNVEKYVFNNRALDKLPDEYPFYQI